MPSRSEMTQLALSQPRTDTDLDTIIRHRAIVAAKRSDEGGECQSDWKDCAEPATWDCAYRLGNYGGSWWRSLLCYGCAVDMRQAEAQGERELLLDRVMQGMYDYRAAAKRYRCSECGGEFLRRDLEYLRYAFDGDGMRHWFQCANCVAVYGLTDGDRRLVNV